MPGKIGIFAASQVGDIITATSVFKYKDELWPGKDIVWFCDARFNDALKFSPVSEIRPYTGDSRGTVPNYQELKRNSGVGPGMNRLDLAKAKNHPSVSDLDDGYFPLPWMLERAEQRAGIVYPQISQRIFGVDLSRPWRPVLGFSDDERTMVSEMMSRLPYPRTVLIENSPCAYSAWNDDLTRLVQIMCRNRWGPTNFFFASGGHRSGNDMSRFFDDPGCISGSDLTARQIALVNDHCNLFVGVAGALTFATSCWGAKPTPKLIYTGSQTFGAHYVANGRIEVVTMESHQHNAQNAENDLKRRLAKLLEEIP
jgi:hypothetical protein